jgi:hypothetical protein
MKGNTMKKEDFNLFIGGFIVLFGWMLGLYVLTVI